MEYKNDVKANDNGRLAMTNGIISKIDYNDLPVFARIIYETGKNGCYRGQDVLIPNSSKSEINESINNLERHNFIKIYVNKENPNETIIIPDYYFYRSFMFQYRGLEKEFISIPDNYVQKPLKHDFIGITVSSKIKSTVKHDVIPLLYNLIEFSEKHPSEVFDPFNNPFDDFQYIKNLTKKDFIDQIYYLFHNYIIKLNNPLSGLNSTVDTPLLYEFSLQNSSLNTVKIPNEYFQPSNKPDYNVNPIEINNSAKKIVDQNKDKYIYIPVGIQEIVNYKYWIVLSQIVELTRSNGRFSSFDSLCGLLNLDRYDLRESLKYLYFNGFIHLYMNSYKKENTYAYRMYLTIDDKIDNIYHENSLYVHEPTVRPESNEITFGNVIENKE